MCAHTDTDINTHTDREKCDCNREHFYRNWKINSALIKKFSRSNKDMQ